MITITLRPGMSDEELKLARAVTNLVAGVGFADVANDETPGRTGEPLPLGYHNPDLTPTATLPRPPAPPVTPGAPIDLDANGLPWDARIHAGTRSQNQDGSWKRRKGVTEEEIAAVTDELRRLLAIPTPGVVPPAPTVPPAPVEAATDDPDLPPAHMRRTDAVAPPAPPVPPAAPAPVAPAVPGVPTTFVELMQRITPLISAKTVGQDQVLIACQTNGVETLMNLTTRADLIPAVWATLTAMVPGVA